LIKDLNVQVKIQKIKQDLQIFRDGKPRGGRRVPDSIRNEIIKLNKAGCSVYQLANELQLASSSVYSWLKSTIAINKKNESVNTVVNNTSKEKKDNFGDKNQKPKQLSLVEDVIASKVSHPITEDRVQLELRSGVKIIILQKQLSFDFLRSLNSL
jgi:hypothetical protein